MAKKKDIIAAGLDGLLNAQAEGKPSRPKASYKTVCYSLPPALVDKIDYIAYWDRKKTNAVVAEAFEQYVSRWKPSQEKLKSLDEL